MTLEPLALAHVPALVEAASESRESYGFADVPDGADEMVAYVDSALREPGVLPFAILLCACFASAAAAERLPPARERGGR